MTFLLIAVVIHSASSGSGDWPIPPEQDVCSTTGPTPPPGMSPGYASTALDYEVVVPGVPAYLWCNGCGPTSAGMVIGYWDGQGFDDLVSGDASTQTLAVNQMMSSTGNYNDYCLPIDLWPNILDDLSEPPPGDTHDDNCLADFMKTSRSASGCTYGGSYVSKVPAALRKYPPWANARYVGTAQNRSWGSLDWQGFRDEIDAGRPLVFTVDTDGNAVTDHYVTVLGYGELNGAPMYGCYHNFDRDIHWYSFEPIGVGRPYGIAYMTTFSLAFDNVTLYVPDDHPTIQEAIAAAVHGDTIIVRAGTYVENIDFLGKAVTLRSESGPEATVIDGGSPADPEKGSCVMFVNDEGPDSILEGFTLTNGTGSFYDGYVMRGGGVFCHIATPTIRGNVITRNEAYYGGGIGLKWFCHGLIEGNRIEANSAEMGGGIDCDGFSNPRIERNCVIGNTAVLNGGGITSQWGSEPTIRFTGLQGNSAMWGGGMSTGWDAEATLECCEIVGNRATENGGGFYSHSAGVEVAVRLENCIVAGNRAVKGGGLDFDHDSQPTVVGCTVFGNSAADKGGGIACRNNTVAVICNTIAWNNDAPNGPEIFIGPANNSSIVTISESDVDGGQASVLVETNSTLNWGAGMIDADPLFADPLLDDFHLGWNSPCRAEGDNSAVTTGEDVEGDPRVTGGTVDMGADEFYFHLYQTGDAIPGGSVDIKVVGYPLAPVWLAWGQGILQQPIATQHGDLWIWPFFWSAHIGNIPADGVLVLPVTISSTWNAGDHAPLQALVGPMGGGYSRLTNLSVLKVE